jgi:hypothetical protein
MSAVEPKKLLAELRGTFLAAAQREEPIKIRLTHLATNAEAEGVVGSPVRFNRTTGPWVALGSAGRRVEHLSLD